MYFLRNSLYYAFIPHNYPLTLDVGNRAVSKENSRGRYRKVNASVALALVPLLHRRRHLVRRWRPEGGFSLHRLVVVELLDLDNLYPVLDQAWDPGLPLVEWVHLRLVRTTCTDLQCLGLGTR